MYGGFSEVGSHIAIPCQSLLLSTIVLKYIYIYIYIYIYSHISNYII